MFNYIIIANKRFKDFDFLQEKLDVLLASRKGSTNLWVYGYTEKDKTEKNICNLVSKYCNWNGISLHTLMEEELDDKDLDDIIVFESEEDPFLRKTKKDLWKFERYKPIEYKI